jgi:lipooligosaccharide transport system permease protein
MDRTRRRFPRPWAQTLAQLNPLYHCVQPVRHAALGFEWADIWNVAALVIFGVLTRRMAIHAMIRKVVK